MDSARRLESAPGAIRPLGRAPWWPAVVVAVAAAGLSAAVAVASWGVPGAPTPVQHFWIVSAVAAIAFAISLTLGVATLQLAVYRVLFLTLGFMSMAGLFTVHGLATPGVIIRGPGYMADAVTVVGVSAYLSLFVPALLFAASYTVGWARLGRVLPYAPAGWLIVLLAVIVAGYGVLAIFETDIIGSLPFSRAPMSWGLAAVTVTLLGYSAVRQALVWRGAGGTFSATMVIAFLLLAEAQVMMVASRTWTPGWWTYHMLMAVAVLVAFYGLWMEQREGRTIRDVVEEALSLQVHAELEVAASDTLAALSRAVELRDHEAEGHNQRVAGLAVALGRALGLPHQRLRTLARGALLHDLGKLAIPDAVLLKPGSLDEEEWQVMRRHPELGVEILGRMGSFRHEARIVIAHHERVDGTGYPFGLARDEIPLEARIVAVADTYDAITSDRPYRRALPAAVARRILLEESGGRLDAAVVAEMVRMIDTGLA